MNVQGAIAAVPGVATGIGAAIAEALASDGAAFLTSKIVTVDSGLAFH